MMDSPPLACNLEAIPADERAARGAVARFTFGIDTPTLQLLAHVIANERLCCPFLGFVVTIAPAGESVMLAMRGPSGPRKLLAMELGLPGG